MNTSAAERLEKMEDTIKRQKEINLKRAAAIKVKKKKKANTSNIIAVVICLALIFSVLFRYNSIIELNDAQEEFNQEYTKIKAENDQNEIALKGMVERKKIEEFAEQKGMIMPERSQMIFLNINQDDYIEVTAKTSPVENEGFISAITNTVNKIIEYLY